MLIDITESTIVFDLDDTLYYEDDYLESGIIAVAREIQRLYGRDLQSELLAAKARRADIWQYACEALALPSSVKESLLWLYRLHRPSISLSASIQRGLEQVASQARHVAIVTDGRALSQRQKLAALGLMRWPLYISEEYQSSKPEPERFRQLMTDLPAQNYAYIADNPQKDFCAPNQLGWHTFGLKPSVRNIHSTNTSELPSINQPKVWIDSLSQLTELLGLSAITN